MATLRRGCTGSIVVSITAVGAAVVTSGMNLWRVAVGAAVGAIDVAAGAAVGAAGAAVAGAAGAAVAGAAGAAVAGAAVAAIVGAVGACVGAAVAAAGVAVSSSSSPPQATMTIAISATIDSRVNICHLLSHFGDFTYTPPGIFQNFPPLASGRLRPLGSGGFGAS